MKEKASERRRGDWELTRERTSGRVGGRKKNKKFGGNRKEAQVGSGDLLCTDTEYKYNTPYIKV